MKELGYRLIGQTPLLMHNNNMANPLNAYTQHMKPLTAKRNKTDRDYMEIARVEWEAGLYLHDGVVALPAENIEACFLRAEANEEWSEVPVRSYGCRGLV